MKRKEKENWGTVYVDGSIYEPKTTGSLLEFRSLTNGYTALFRGNLI